MKKEEIIAMLTALPTDAEITVYCPITYCVVPDIAVSKTGANEYISVSSATQLRADTLSARNIMP